MKLRIVHRPWLARPYVIEEKPGKDSSWKATGTSALTETEARALIERSKTERVVAEFTIG